MGLPSKESRSVCNGLHIKITDDLGKGVFASNRIYSGDPIMIFGGEQVSSADIVDFTHYLQIGPDLYLGPSGDYDDYVNHNCDPNCAVYFENDQVVLKAIKDICPEEQLSLDYGTIQFNEPTVILCQCGSENCRKIIGNFYLMPEDLQNRYLDDKIVPLLTKYTKEDLKI